MARILIIEDNLGALKLATMVLEWTGHAVLGAGDAETGMSIARTALPDLILMDVVLPGMSGLAAAALLKADPLTAAIPIIALSWKSAKSDETRAMAAGCDAFIAKPFGREELNATVKNLLPKDGTNHFKARS